MTADLHPCDERARVCAIACNLSRILLREHCGKNRGGKKKSDPDSSFQAGTELLNFSLS